MSISAISQILLEWLPAFPEKDGHPAASQNADPVTWFDTAKTQLLACRYPCRRGSDFDKPRKPHLPRLTVFRWRKAEFEGYSHDFVRLGDFPIAYESSQKNG
jgi:hypothetical protein